MEGKLPKKVFSTCNPETSNLNYSYMEFDKQVQLPAHHFRKAAKREYFYWRRALIREFYQNSVDANAENIHFTLEETPENYVLTVKDDGKGMSIHDVEEKLLTMGGTDKGEESIGGYGVAKQILYFAWPYWEIYSSDFKIVGSGCRYKILPHEYTNGVTSIVHLSKDESFTASHIHDYLKLCSSKVKTLVNNQEFTDWQTYNETIKTLSWATLYKRDEISGNINVQVRGVSMFYSWISPKPGLTLELTGNAREILTSNRDGLNEPYASEYNKILSDINVNSRSALKPEKQINIHTFEGRGNTFVGIDNFDVPNADRQVNQARAALHHEELKSKFYIPEDEETKSTFSSFGKSFSQKEEIVETFIPTILVKSIGDVPKKYNPATWNQKTEKTMALWQHIVRQIFRDNKATCIFGIGMTFDEDTRAEILYKNGVPFFLINPEIWHHKFNLSGKSKWLVIQEMKQRAIHEIAHFATDSNNHNEDFILTTLALEANTWRNDKAYKNLNKNKIEFLK